MARAFRQLRDGGMGEAEARAVSGFESAGRVVDLTVESPAVQNINRHVWELLAAVGVALMALRMAGRRASTKRSCSAWGLASQRRAFSAGVTRAACTPPGDLGTGRDSPPPGPRDARDGGTRDPGRRDGPPVTTTPGRGPGWRVGGIVGVPGAS